MKFLRPNRIEITLFVVGVLLMLIGFGIDAANGAEPAAKPRVSVPSDVEPMPYVAAAQQTKSADEAFGRRQPKQDDEGLKKLLEKKFEIERPNVFVGFRIAMWGLTVAGILLGLFFFAVIVILTLRLLRKTLVPAVTGLPPAESIVGLGSMAILQLLDNATKQLQDRRDRLAAEQAEIDARLGTAPKKAK